MRTRWAELRTAATGIDPGLVRLRLATGALLSIVLALALAVALQRLTGEQPTVVIMAAVLAMVSNIAVNETAVERLRVTTALLVLPATAAVALGTVLAPHRLLADAVFVAIMVGGVYIRRFGPRGFAIGMAAVMAYFFSQFLGAQVSALPVARPHRGLRCRDRPGSCAASSSPRSPSRPWSAWCGRSAPASTR